jgi:hypothetical protein
LRRAGREVDGGWPDRVAMRVRAFRSSATALEIAFAMG